MFGMNVMSSNLEKLSGGKLQQLLKKATANPVVSLALGAIITIAVQSSSAVTVMLVGLVNSGIMQFSQTLFVIFGANIGTTLTAWILGMSSLEGSLYVQLMKPVNFSCVIAFIGVILLMFAKKDKNRTIGTIFIGFAVLMYGMDFMSKAVSPLAGIKGIENIFASFKNPVLAVLVGAIFTAIIQSSAASVGILQALALTGLIKCDLAIPIVMGQNIGTCITAVISAIGTNPKAKRVAAMHTELNVFGTVICLVIFEVVQLFLPLELSTVDATPFLIALFHTAFNIIITISLMPFSKQIIKLTELVVKDNTKTVDIKPINLDERLLRSPSVAVEECDAYTLKMSEISFSTIDSAFEILTGYSEEKAATINEQEKIVDEYEDGLGTYLVKLSSAAISDPDTRKISKMLHVIGNFERLSDHSVNLAKVAKEIHDKKIVFSDEANSEITVLEGAVKEIIRITAEAYSKTDVGLAGRVEPLEQVIDHIIAEIRANHIVRLRQGVCTIELGFVLSDLLTNLERISDHCSNIAVAIIETAHDSFDTHNYLNEVKHGNSEFDEIYKHFNEKYSIVNL